MQYPTTICYKGRTPNLLPEAKNKKLKTYTSLTKLFPSRTRAKKFLKDHPLKYFFGMVSEGRPDPVVEEK